MLPRVGFVLSARALCISLRDYKITIQLKVNNCKIEATIYGFDFTPNPKGMKSFGVHQIYNRSLIELRKERNPMVFTD